MKTSLYFWTINIVVPSRIQTNVGRSSYEADALPTKPPRLGVKGCVYSCVINWQQGSGFTDLDKANNHGAIALVL